MLQSSVTFSTAQESDLSIKSLKKCVNSVECFCLFVIKTKKKKKKKQKMNRDIVPSTTSLFDVTGIVNFTAT